MTDIVYRIVEHDGGFAYKVGDVFSETFSTREEAVDAAHRAAAEQQLPAEAESVIRYQDGRGGWHSEVADGRDRPDARVED